MIYISLDGLLGWQLTQRPSGEYSVTCFTTRIQANPCNVKKLEILQSPENKVAKERGKLI